MACWWKFSCVLIVGSIVADANKCGKNCNRLKKLDWWEHTVVYEVIVKSFKDSDGDGSGDLRGLINNLDYFVDLGVETLWLTPVYESPFLDLGYDISNFYKIDGQFGTLADYEELVEKAHQRGLRVLLDYVVNHASTASCYFKKSEARVPGYENLFVWADGKPDPSNKDILLPPSNWISEFGRNMWTWNENRQQFYLHQFAISEADGNNTDPGVIRERLNILRYWLDKGVDGIRVDAIDYFYEADPKDFGGMYPDEPLSSDRYATSNEASYLDTKYTKFNPQNYELLYSWRELFDSYAYEFGTDTKILISEAFGDIKQIMKCYEGNGKQGAQLSFNFDFIFKISCSSDARDYAYAIKNWLTYLPHGHVANWVSGNHDRERVSNRLGPNMVDGINALVMILPGVAVSYYGDEIGMRKAVVTLAQSKDEFVRETGNLTKSRDPNRAPFQWDDTTSAGFSTNQTTWLPLAEDYKTINLKAQMEADRSHYKVYRDMVRLRKEEALSHGHTHVQAITCNTLLVVRYLEGYCSYALLFNVGKEADEVDLSRDRFLKAPMTVRVSSVNSKRCKGDKIPLRKITLQPGEALVLRFPSTGKY